MAAQKLGGWTLSFRAAMFRSPIVFRFSLDGLKWERGTARSLPRTVSRYVIWYFHLSLMNYPILVLTLRKYVQQLIRQFDIISTFYFKGKIKESLAHNIPPPTAHSNLI